MGWGRRGAAIVQAVTQIHSASSKGLRSYTTFKVSAPDIYKTAQPGTSKISCMKRGASPGSMHNTGCLGLVHWDDPEGWYGV